MIECQSGQFSFTAKQWLEPESFAKQKRFDNRGRAQKFIPSTPQEYMKLPGLRSQISICRQVESGRSLNAAKTSDKLAADLRYRCSLVYKA